MIAKIVADMGAKIGALEIIFKAPLWPDEKDIVTEEGRALFRRIVADAKPYALAVVQARYAEALQMLVPWTPLLNAAIDSVKVVDDAAMQNLLAVAVYYMNVVADWSKIQAMPENAR